MATLTIMGSGVSNGNMVETYMPYATYTSAAIANVTNGSDVGICSNAKTIIWDKSTVSTNDSGWYIFAVKEDLWIDLSANPVVVTTKDPNAPPGDHNTLIDGTAYAIGGGKVLVGGTAFSIDAGKTMVGGTVYDLNFHPNEIIINITGSGGSGSMTYCYVQIEGTNYKNATTLTIPYGTSITAVSKGTTSKTVTFNGESVASTYTFTPDTETVNIKLYYKKASSTNIQTDITITTS